MDNKEGGVASVRQLATVMNLSYQGVRKVLVGDSHAFNAENNEKAASWLGVTSRWLATGKEPRKHQGNATSPIAGLHASDTESSAYRPATQPIHPDAWIAEAVRTLENMTPADRRAAAINLRVFVASLHPPENGQALPVAA